MTKEGKHKKSWLHSVWLRLLFVMLTGAASLQASAYSDLYWPVIDLNRGTECGIADNKNLYYAFDWLIYCYQKDNSFYTSAPHLYINGEDVLNLHDTYQNYGGGIAICGRGNEDDYKNLRDGKRGACVAKRTVQWKGSNLHVTMYPVGGTSANNIWLTVVVELERWYPGQDIKFKIGGNWASNNKEKGFQWSRINNNDSWEWNPTSPIADMPQTAGTFTSTGNRTVTYTQNDMKVLKAHGSDWAYRFRMCNQKPASEMDYVSGNYAELTAPTSATSYTGTFTIPDNHKNTTIYPIIERYSTTKIGFSGYQDEVKFAQVYEPVVIPGFPCSKNVKATPNIWEEKIQITWDTDEPTGYNSSNTNSKGTWAVYRSTDQKNWAPISDQTFNYGTHSCFDSNAEKNVGYYYAVVFVPNTWNISKLSSVNPEDFTSLYSVTDQVKLVNNFKISSVKVEQPDKANYFNINWTISQPFQKSGTYIFKVYRATNGGDWESIGEQTTSSTKQTSFTYQDNTVKDGSSCDSYSYRVTLDLFGDVVYCENNTMYSLATDAVGVTSVSCSKGAYSNMVKITWKAVQAGSTEQTYAIKRRILGSNDEFKTIREISGTNTSYSYDDTSVNPGDYYEYLVESSTTCKFTGPDGEETTTRTQSAGDDGFSIAYGIVSGRISYGTGTAVAGVTVNLEPEASSGLDEVKSHSMQFISGSKDPGVITMALKENDARSLFVGKPWTLQMYAKVDDFGSDNVDKEIVLFAGGNDDIVLKLTKDGSNYWHLQAAYPTVDDDNNECTSIDTNLDLNLTNKGLNPAEFLNYVLSYDGKNTLTLTALNKTDKSATVSYECTYPVHYNSNCGLYFGHTDGSSEGYSWDGYLDEVRFYTNRELTQKELKASNFIPLTGSEKGLQIYWPMNEGISNQKSVYDNSFTDNRTNGHHASLQGSVASSETVPFNESSVGYSAVTDESGNYVVRRLPFNGEGTNYIVRPVMGIHEFNPNYCTRYISANSLVHSGVDFEDKSSFPVKGYVFYENTNYPVEGAYLYVDGQPAAREGEAVMTNSDGEFNVDCPIGKHSIKVVLRGHTFVDGGRYPADPDNVGTTVTIDKEVNDLTFYDNTLVNVAGRLAGGNVEYDKPLGFNTSVANMGQAEITLTYQGGKDYYINAYVPKDETKPVYARDTLKLAQASSFVNSKAYILGGTADDGDNTKTIHIFTDPQSGEWAAKLPPLKYEMTSIRLLNNPEGLNFTNYLTTIDASNPESLTTDSLEEDMAFSYVASNKIRYHKPAVFEVSQRYQPEFFGESTVTAKDNSNNDVEYALVNKDAEGNFTGYKHTYPIFFQTHTYTFDFYAYEPYTNYDSQDEEGNYDTQKVPLSDASVTISNQMSNSNAVYISNGAIYEMEGDTLSLDSVGKATYQFRAGFPNLQNPYTRQFSLSYDDNGDTKTWTGNELFNGTGIIFGSLTTGNNFVTSGPDKVTMILRDPPGSNSSATWAKEVVSTKKVTQNVSLSGSLDVKQEAKAGVTTIMVLGVGVAKESDIEAVNNVSADVKISGAISEDNTWTWTTTTSNSFSTKDDESFVGAPGDIFIGTATNMIFGGANEVGIHVNGNGAFNLDKKDILTVGQEFGTTFAYTQNQIEGGLIPRYDSLKVVLLTQFAVGTDPNEITRPAAGEDPIYVSMLDRDDENFGKPNNDPCFGDKAKAVADCTDAATGIIWGPSYAMIPPADWNEKVYEDKVSWYNAQISLWEKQLWDNEKAKVDAISNRDKWLDKNYSFDAGTVINESTTSTDAHEWSVSETVSIGLSCGATIGAYIDHVGSEVTISTESEAAETVGGGGESSTAKTFSYTLADAGDDDYFSVDVFKAPDGYGPIFYTRAGATSCPYEDEVKTKYYKPGTTIMEATVQIENPELTMHEGSSSIVSGVPSGKAAQFKVDFNNNSWIAEPGWYTITVVDDKNSDGASVWMDGDNITKGRTIYLPYGTTTKTIQIKQTDESVLEFENITLKLASQCQKDDSDIYPEIASYLPLTAKFQATGSDIELAATSTTVNTKSLDAITLKMSGYDVNSKILDRIALQQFNSNTNQWVALQQYVKKDDARLNGNEYKEIPVLTGVQTLDYIIDLRESQYINQDYTFRAVTVSNINGQELVNPSEEIVIVRDMSRPQLIANPSPSNGILTSDGEVSITFNEDIRSNMLNKNTNFLVKGVLNESKLVHESALAMPAAAGTKTDAIIDLSNRSFALNFWMKYTQAGQILQQGTEGENFTLAINSDNKLEVTIGDQTYTSEVTVPTDQWCFYSVSYDNQGAKPQLNIDYANDASQVSLFRNTDVASYTGNGPITLGGNGLTGQMHELTLWNNARSVTEALSGMYTTKNIYTKGLSGYWQLNEGHGTKATDLSRNRHMTVPASGAWYLDNVNYAMALTGDRIGNFVTSFTEDEDYLVETWFRADAAQSGVASVLSMNLDGIDLRLNEAGQMELIAKGSSYSVGSDTYNDNSWHHLALNVLKSTNGSAVVYVDGMPQRQLNASALPSLSGNIFLGGHRYTDEQGLTKYNQTLKGAVDEVRVWRGRRTADAITENMYRRVANDEEGLVAYYPMEISELDQYNQRVYKFSKDDHTGLNENGLTFFNVAQAQKTTNEEGLKTENTPSLKSAASMTSVDYSFVSDERKILINLDADAEKIEGCTLQFTVREVRDANNNVCSPITWTAFVQQNQLKWAENEIDVRKVGTANASFKVKIENNSASAEGYVISNLPAWLSVSSETGSLAPLATKELTFTVSGSAPVGKYEQPIYLTGNLGVAEALLLNLTSLAQTPDWTVNPDEYELSMGVIGQLKVEGVYSSDTEDIVAAFQDGKCVGVAHPKYMSKYDSYFVTMTIYGVEADPEETPTPLQFKVFDASTGTTYPIAQTTISNAVSDIYFISDDLKGTYKSPVLITPTNYVEQSIALRKGWSWISFYVEPRNTAIADIFVNNPYAVLAKSRNSYSQVSEGAWFGELRTLSDGNLYKVNSTEASDLSVIGTMAHGKSIQLANGWNWIGYNSQSTMSLNDAFASANPVENDIVKCQNGFAIYTDGEWIGTLEAMTPGMGYTYKSLASGNKTFTYPIVSASSNMAPRRIKAEDYVNADYANNMTMTAVVMDGNSVVDASAVAVVCGNELRGLSTTTIEVPCEAGTQPEHFITIAGDNNGDVLNFIVTVDGFDYTLKQTELYQNDAMFGTVKVPYVLQLGDATDIHAISDDANGSIYDLAGRRLPATKQRGVYIHNGVKVVK